MTLVLFVSLAQRVGLIPLGDGEYLAIRAVANNNATYLGPEDNGAQTSMDMALLELAVVGARPLGIMNLMRFGQSDQIANQQLLQRAVAGIAEYGNTYGVPVVGGDLYFHKDYNMGAMMNSCALGGTNYRPLV